MNRIKRKVSIHELFNEEPKKSKIEVSIHTSLEDLSNEILYEIFEYLDGYHIFKAFSKLNVHLEHLLNHSSFLLKIKLSADLKHKLKQFYQDFLLPNRHRLLSLYLSGSEFIDSCLFDYSHTDQSLVRLQFIVLSTINIQNLLIYLRCLNSLPRLFSLIIYLDQEEYYNFSDAFRVVFRLQELKYFKLAAFSDDHTISNMCVPISINENYSRIEHMKLLFQYNLNELTSLLLHTPHLRRLTCGKLTETDEIHECRQRLALPYLTCLSIDKCNISIIEFHEFIKKICSELRIFRLRYSCNETYIDPNQWQNLIENHMFHLVQFHLNCYIFIGDIDDFIVLGHETINLFTTPFWTERQWIFQLMFGDDEVIYSIHPNQKQWYNSRNCNQVTPYSNQSTRYSATNGLSEDKKTIFIPSVHLSFYNSTSFIYDKRFLTHLKNYFASVQFTYLSIYGNGLDINLFLQLLKPLSNLSLLKISLESFTQWNNLWLKDSDMFQSISMNNKITKVNLTKFYREKQVQFWIDLCPHMEYLDIGCATQFDIERIVQCVSKHPLKLKSLCFNIPNANEKMTEHLHNIIDNQVFRNYRIQRQGNRIFLDWNF